MAEVQTRTVATGTDGNLSFAALNSGYVPQGKISYWTLGIFQVLNDITGFDSGGYKEYIGGVKGASWGATMSNKMAAATTNPFGGSTVSDILGKDGATATFTVATASLITGLTACNIVWHVIVQSHTLGQDVNGASVSSLSGVCSGAPTTIAWDES
jgi:hypothetical protein